MKLAFSKIINRVIRQDPAPELGRSTISHALEAMDRGDLEGARRALEYARKEWEVVHDIYTNLTWSLLTFIAKTLGEDSLEKAFRVIFGGYFKTRYRTIVGESAETQLQLAVEGLRGHLMGPGRMGEIEIEEQPERYKLTLAPCSSGGVARQRVESGNEPFPENFGYAEKIHPWTWGKENVCFYCAHCSFVNEILPIENFGHPMRITEYPKNAADPCVWYIYKDPAKIPAEYYERVGKSAPAQAPRITP